MGASPSSRAGSNLVQNLQFLGYEGSIYPVNPRYPEVRGIRCYPNLSSIPDVVDAAVISIAADSAVTSLKEAAAMGVSAVVVTSAGFADSGALGSKKQQELLRIAQAHNIALCGPNCMGLISLTNSLAMYIGAIPSRLRRGSVGVVSQSGSVLIALLESQRLGFSHLISSGNEAVTDASQYLNVLVNDPETEVLVAFLEGLRSPALFMKVAESAQSMGKPFLVLKVGKSKDASTAAIAHTGALVGSSDVFDAVCRKYGIIRVQDLDELIESAQLLSACIHRPLGRGRVACITGSGGQVGLLLDLAAGIDFDFPKVSPATVQKLEIALNRRLPIANPLDAWGTGDLDKTLREALGALEEDASIDVIAVCQDASPQEPGQAVIAAAVAKMTSELASRTPKPVVFFTLVSGGVDESVRQVLASSSTVILMGARQSLLALASLARFAERALHDRRPTLPAIQDRPPSSGSGHGRRQVLSEFMSLAFVAAQGIPVAATKLARSENQAIRAAEELGFPVALKACSPQLPHKARFGAVALNVTNPTEVRAAYRRVTRNALKVATALEGVIVQEMRSGLELLTGLRRDPEFGPVVALGLGGSFTEILHDVTIGLVPLSAEEATEMLEQFRGGALLTEVFGNDAGKAKSSLSNVLLRLSAVGSEDEALVELDLNPLLVSRDRIAVVDALVVRSQRNDQIKRK